MRIEWHITAADQGLVKRLIDSQQGTVIVTDHRLVE
jgi:hypothetical protein